MNNVKPVVLDIVALLSNHEGFGLVQGQVGTVVELFDGDQALVEFCDGNGVAFAIPTLPLADLLQLAFGQVVA